MEVTSLSELYSKVQEKTSILFVVPLIRFSFPNTDYLFLLYKEYIENNSSTLVKSISVFGHFRFVGKALTDKNTILHYHWLEFQDAKSLLGMPFKLLCIAIYSLLNGKIVWTVHNLNPHDKKFLGLHRIIHKWMAKKSSLLHVHSKSAIGIVSKAYDVSKDKIIVLKHPRFPSEILEKEEASKKFLSHYREGFEKLEDPTFLIFGGISEYKGIREVIEILISKNKPFSLIIAGYLKKGQKSLHNFIIEKTIDDDRVIYIPSFIPDEHYPLLLSMVDVCIFNYEDILTSGGVEMALSYQKEIIAPYKGGIVDSDSPLISTFNSENDLEKLIDKKLDAVNHV